MARRLSTWVLATAIVAGLLSVARADDDVCNNFQASAVLCPDDYQPICGSDGVTYSNACNFMVAKCNLKGALTSVDGECPANFECPLMCEMNYSPYCGTDGKTYGNLCALVAARCSMARQEGVRTELVSLQNEGECAATMCIDDYEPVCATNGETFMNECMLQAAARERGITLSVAFSGTCESAAPESCDIVCTDKVSPVCGNNGVTYVNECTLNAVRCTEGIEWLSVFERGSCDDLCPDMCMEMYAPVCTNTGATFPGVCEFFQSRCAARAQGDAARPIIAHLGECVHRGCDLIDCIEQEAPVCGTDGVTYSNECALARASCLGGTDLTICHQGACAPKEEPRCSLRCDKRLEEVCGSDGRTYKNPCLLNAEACRRREKISVASYGACQSIDVDEPSDACANVVCEDGYVCVAQSRECFAPPCLQYTCERRTCERSPAVPVSPSCERMCTMEYKPVCGSDGVIYTSLCNLESASCLRAVQGLAPLVPRDRLSDCKCDCFEALLRQNWASFAGKSPSLPYSDFAAIVIGMGATAEQATSMFVFMDTNNDGVLTEEEFSAYQTAEEVPPSDPTDTGSWYEMVVFGLGAVLGVAVVAIGVALIFRTTTAPSSALEPLLG